MQDNYQMKTHGPNIFGEFSLEGYPVSAKNVRIRIRDTQQSIDRDLRQLQSLQQNISTIRQDIPNDYSNEYATLTNTILEGVQSFASEKERALQAKKQLNANDISAKEYNTMVTDYIDSFVQMSENLKASYTNMMIEYIFEQYQFPLTKPVDEFGKEIPENRYNYLLKLSYENLLEIYQKTKMYRKDHPL